jgi:hypothetical protein
VSISCSTLTKYSQNYNRHAQFSSFVLYYHSLKLTLSRRDGDDDDDGDRDDDDDDD